MKKEEEQVPDWLSIALLICFLSLISISQAQSNREFKPFIIIGKITGMDSGKIAITYSQSKVVVRERRTMGPVVCDTVQIKNGVFYFEGNIPGPTVATINCERFKYITSFYIDSGIMELALTTDKFKELKLTGSKTQDEINDLIFIQKPLNDISDYLKAELRHLDSLYRKTKDEKILNKANNTSEKIDSLHLKIIALSINFIRSHPKSYISKRMLDDKSFSDYLTLDSLKTLYNGLSKDIRTSINGQRIKKEITERKKSVVGVKTPEFKTVDINDKPLYLADFKGKNEVLLVFWSSWNFYSRKALPHLNEIFKKYQSNGLVLIGAASVITKDQWKKLIDQDSLKTWLHVRATGEYIRDPKTVDNLLELYSVNGNSYYDILPVEILINKRGKIIGRWQGDLESLDKKLKEFYKSY